MAKRKTTEADEPEQFDSVAEDGELFEQTPRIGTLDKKGVVFLDLKDKAKTAIDKRNESEAECIKIMRQHEITQYNRGRLHLRIKESEKLEGSLD